MRAARAETRKSDLKTAEAILWRATKASPGYTDAYAELVTEVYGPEKNLEAASFTAERGIDNGAAPLELYVALARAAESADNETLCLSTSS